MLAHFSPGQLVNLSMQGIYSVYIVLCSCVLHVFLHSECSVAVVMDHMQTLESSLTQSKLDLHKRWVIFYTTRPLVSAMVCYIAVLKSCRLNRACRQLPC